MAENMDKVQSHLAAACVPTIKMVLTISSKFSPLWKNDSLKDAEKKDLEH